MSKDDLKTRALNRARELIEAGNINTATELVIMATSIDSALDLVGIVSVARATEMLNAHDVKTIEKIIDESIRFAERETKRELDASDRVILVTAMKFTFEKHVPA